MRRALLLDALQHPAVLVPAFAAAVMSAYGLLLPPVRSPLLPLAVVFVLIALGAAAWRARRGHALDWERGVRDALRAGDRGRRVREDEELESLRRDLGTAFDRLGHRDGTLILERLDAGYLHLCELLQRWPSTGAATPAHLPGLARETYRHGLTVLDGALHLLDAVRSTDRDALERERERLQGALRVAAPDNRDARRRRFVERRHADVEARLATLTAHELRAEECLFNAAAIEGALHRGRIELASLRALGAEADVASVSDSLVTAITRTREVLEEVRGAPTAGKPVLPDEHHDHARHEEVRDASSTTP